MKIPKQAEKGEQWKQRTHGSNGRQEDERLPVTLNKNELNTPIRSKYLEL